MKSIDAMITWTPNRDPFLQNPTCGQVRVIHHNVEPDNNDIPCSVGACNAGWKEMSVEDRQTEINEIYRRMVEEDNIDPAYAKKQIGRIEDVVMN
ncbi:hypothetical protein ABE527_14625 [Brucella sp. TWI432]